MAKEQDGSPKPRHPEFQRMRVTLTIGVIGLCVTSYILGAWQGTSNSIKPSFISTKTRCDNMVRSSGTHLDFQAHHQVSFNESSLAPEKFPPCQLKYSEYTPCQDPRKARKFPKNMMQYRERHCPKKEDMLRCLIPAPPGYKNPFEWPKSRDYAWYNNIPHRELSIEKAVQNWIQVEGDLLRFPGGGTMFPHGADAYIDNINALIPLNDGNIRTALDTGCGVSDLNHFSMILCVLLFSRTKKSFQNLEMLYPCCCTGCKLGCLSYEEEHHHHVICTKGFTRGTGAVCIGAWGASHDWSDGD